MIAASLAFASLAPSLVRTIVSPEQESRHRARSGRIPPELSAVAMKALSLRPEDRYASLEALRRDIERFQEGCSVSVKEDTRRELFLKLVKRNKGVSAATAAALVLLTVVVVWSSWVNYKARKATEPADRQRADGVPVHGDDATDQGSGDALGWGQRREHHGAGGTGAKRSLAELLGGATLPHRLTPERFATPFLPCQGNNAIAAAGHKLR
jgi:hypothetical protein